MALTALLLGLSATTSARLTPASALEIWSDATVVNTFDSDGAIGWRVDTSENRRTAANVMHRVRRAIARYESQSTACGRSERCAMGGWYALLDGLRNTAAAEKLEAVNRWVNRIPYVSDWRNWGVADYWESPGELIARGGQCEDYALVKYIALRALGFSASSMRIVAVHNGLEDHAILVVRIDGRNYVLDNLERHVVESSAAPAYRLIYAVNENSFWHYTRVVLADAQAPQSPSDPYQPIEKVAAIPATPVAPVAPSIPGVRPLTTAEIAELPIPAESLSPATPPVEQTAALPDAAPAQAMATSPY